MSDDLQFLMPGSWRHIPVADATASTRVIRRVVEARAGRADDRAQLRAEMRSQFQAATDRARSAGGRAMWVCDEITAGVPLPATLTAYDPGLTIPRLASHEEQVRALLALLGPAEDTVAEADLKPDGRAAVRRARIVHGQPAEGTDLPEVDSVEVDYWILQPDGRHVLLLSFTCGMPRLAGKLTQLFDVIVLTLRWSDAAAA